MVAVLPTDEESRTGTRDWPHAPPHRLQKAGVYFVTARTRNRIPHFDAGERRTLLQDMILALASRYAWTLEAWAVLNNHYHLVAHSPPGVNSAQSLGKFLKHLHADSAREVNRVDAAAGRIVWQNYRDTHLTYQNSYLARLNYTHTNAVHHHLVGRARDYPWCSARPFIDACTPARVKTISSFHYDDIARGRRRYLRADRHDIARTSVLDCGNLFPLSALATCRREMQVTPLPR